MRRGLMPAVAATALFVAAATMLLSSVWRAGITEVVPQATSNALGEPIDPDWQLLTTADTELAAWLVPRHARTLARSPWRLFETEHCAPDSTTLAFGEPMITLGALAIPFRAAAGPVAAYNLTLVALFVVSALAMYLLIVAWTGSAAAATAAAILYAFNAERIADISHPFIYDTAWTVLGLYFARRWLAGGRWRDALGLALCGALQLGTSLYPIIASLLLWVPIAVWLLRSYGLRHVRWLQVATVVGVVLAATYVIFSPYLDVRAATDTLRRTEQHFAAWSWLAPHREAGVAWTTLVLAAVALALPHAASDEAPDPVRGVRWAIAAGALLVALAATGPNAPRWWTALWSGDPPLGWPNLYAALGALLPGLDAIRVPARIETGSHLGLCILAGLGAAALLQRGSRFAHALGVAIIVAAVAETAVLVAPVRPSQARGSLVTVAPAPDDVQLFASLARMGNDGAVLELPMGDADHEFLFRAPRRVLLTASQGRRTSACYGSFLPPGREQLRLDSLELPAAGAMTRICAQGFTTALVHLDTPLGRHAADRFLEASMSAGGGTSLLASSRSIMAFSLCDESRGF